MILANKNFNSMRDPEVYDVFMKNFSHFVQRPKIIIGTGGNLDIPEVIVKVVNDLAIRRLPKYYIFEPTYTSYVKLRNRFKDTEWIIPCHALSLEYEESRIFIENDSMLNKENINSEENKLTIDSFAPRTFYTTEIEGGLLGDLKTPTYGKIYPIINSIKGDKSTLFILDGPGGLGWLEFQTVANIMGPKKYDIFIKNLNHIKNYRTLNFIKNKKEWRLMRSRENQWAYIKHYKGMIKTVPKEDVSICFPEMEEYYDK